MGVARRDQRGAQRLGRQTMNRQAMWDQLVAQPEVDLAVVGGGASGLGVALEAVRQGARVALFESHDLASGTSSRSTKLLHGGVRYLAQGHWPLVREALAERSAILRMAPHVAQRLPFVVPVYREWERWFYGLGLLAYDGLATWGAGQGLGRTAWLGRNETLRCLPGLKPEGLRGGIRYWDAQFDDARLAVAVARTVVARGGIVLNRAPVVALQHTEGRLSGVVVRNGLTGDTVAVRAAAVVNAAGVWVDAVRALDEAARGDAPPAALVTPSQGVHLVVDALHCPGHHALLVPRTRDGRVLFAVPWHGKVLLGTTDTPRPDCPREPAATPQEVAFLLEESARVLRQPVHRSAVRSVWVGLRPLVRPPSGGEAATAQVSREHVVVRSASGLVTVAGGKWTTFLAMARDVMAHCRAGGWRPSGARAPAHRPNLQGHDPGAFDAALWGAPPSNATDASGCAGLQDAATGWGSEVAQVRALDGGRPELAPGLGEGDVRHAARFEMAVTVEDVLARRTRWLFLDAAAAARLAPAVAALLAEETGQDPELAAFLALCERYRLQPSA